ncbi:hypothetical protein J4467_01900 [Candidatus Woesearchaeota archaeon]|nr:hypothetical protein [Candidatus Woesearchaeota archaeon]
MLENLVRTAIRKENLDINYDGYTATNHFGWKYKVSIEQGESCFDVPYIKPLEQKIVLKTGCEVSDQGKYLAHSLAHELGHSETFFVTTPILALIAFAGLSKAYHEKCIKTFLYTCATVASYRLVVDEAVAEIAASVNHGTIMMDWRGDVSDIIDFSRRVIDLF